MKYWSLTLCALFAASVQAQGVAVGVKAGTTGLGVEGYYQVSPMLNVRAHYSRYSATFSQDTGGDGELEFDMDTDLGMGALLLDFYPFSGSFHLSAGYAKNNTGFAGVATASGGNYTIDGQEYSAAQIGEVRGELSFKSSAPYVGLGWGNPIDDDGGFGVNFELGAILQGAPKAKITTSKQLSDPAAQAQLEQHIQQEITSFEDDTSSFKAWPVIALGITYQF